MSERTHIIRSRLEVRLWWFIDILAGKRIQEPGTKRLFMLMFTLSPPIVYMRQPARLRVDAGAFTISDDAVVAAFRPAGYRGRAVFGRPRRRIVSTVVTLGLFLSEFYRRQTGLYT